MTNNLRANLAKGEKHPTLPWSKDGHHYMLTWSSGDHHYVPPVQQVTITLRYSK